MRRVSFILAMFGLFFLTLMIYQSPKLGGSLKDYEINEVIKVSGILSSIRSGKIYTNFKIGEYDAYCDCDVSYLSGKSVSLEGVVTEYKGARSIRASRIT